MKCDAARSLLLSGNEADLDASEMHLATCAACFDWLEAQDPLVSLIRTARPVPAPAPARLARRVLSTWRSGLPQPARQQVRLELVAAAALLLAGFGALGLVLAAPALPNLLVATAPLNHAAIALLALPQRFLLANPAWLSALLVMASGACVLVTRVFAEPALQRRSQLT